MSRVDKHRYAIEISHDGDKWIHKGGFNEGDLSRFNKPFDADTALQEAKSYREHFGDKFKYVRVIIEL